jgi:hypothetical protein
LKTDARVFDTIYIVKERERSIGRVTSASGVAEKRARPNGRILARGADKKCPGAYACVEAGVGVAQECIEANCCVVNAGGDT